MRKRQRFSAGDWVELGLSELAERGSDAVKLEAICKSAGLTRGSFYHHFPDHGAFLTALAKTWMDRQTKDLAAQISDEASADKAAAQLTEASFQINFRLEIGMRELARRVPEINKLVKETDALRLKILTDLHAARFNLDAAEAEKIAMIEYAAFTGVIAIDPEITADKQRELAALFDQLLQRALPKQ